MASTVAPIIGGKLAHPVERFPEIFGNSELFKAYPYLLPCLTVAIFPLMGNIINIFFLKEASVGSVALSSIALLDIILSGNQNTAVITKILEHAYITFQSITIIKRLRANINTRIKAQAPFNIIHANATSSGRNP